MRAIPISAWKAAIFVAVCRLVWLTSCIRSFASRMRCRIWRLRDSHSNSSRQSRATHTPAAETLRASRRSWLSQAHELIKSRFLEHLTLGDIAHTVGVHPVTLAREFRHHYDCTVGELVRRERIGFACRELLKPDESIADIAIAAGFYDQSHFAKTFKKLTGITPAEYRVSYRLH